MFIRAENEKLAYSLKLAELNRMLFSGPHLNSDSDSDSD